MQSRTKVRRRVLACARCRKRKLSCDGKVPACTRCVDAGVNCVGFDSSTQREAPRSIADYLESYIASIEDPKSPASQRKPTAPGPARPGDVHVLPSPAASNDCDPVEKSTSTLSSASTSIYADSLVNQVMTDLTPSFLGISRARPILSCVVKGTQLPSRKGLVESNDLDDRHPKSIVNPLSSTNCLDGMDYKTARHLLDSYMDRILPQYPIYHRSQVQPAFNSIFSPMSAPGQDSPRHRYIISIIMAISLSTAARTNQPQANALAYTLVRQAMHFIPAVATNDLSGLQAMLLLAQYTFLNPSMADLWLLTGLITQAVIDLGLHQELPNDVNVTPYERDMRRRLFWCAWEMEVGVCCIFSRPVNLPIDRIDVAFPIEVDDTYITPAGINLNGPVSKFTSRRICLFRMIEAEIYAVLRHGKPIPKECPTLEAWMERCEARILEWQREIHIAEAANRDPTLDARWKEMKLYSDVATSYIRVALYRPHPANPMPTLQQQMTAFVNAVEVADGYWQQSNADYGRTKYVFHTCHHVFSCANVFLQVLQRCKEEIAKSYQWQQIEDMMECFSRCFATIAERWAAASRCQEEYERSLASIKEEYRDFLRRTAVSPTIMPRLPEPPLSVPIGGTMSGICKQEPVDMDNIKFWAIFTPAKTCEPIDSVLLNTSAWPHDWKEEFSLESAPLSEFEQKFVATV